MYCKRGEGSLHILGGECFTLASIVFQKCFSPPHECQGAKSLLTVRKAIKLFDSFGSAFGFLVHTSLLIELL